MGDLVLFQYGTSRGTSAQSEPRHKGYITAQNPTEEQLSKHMHVRVITVLNTLKKVSARLSELPDLLNKQYPTHTDVKYEVQFNKKLNVILEIVPACIQTIQSTFAFDLPDDNIRAAILEANALQKRLLEVCINYMNNKDLPAKTKVPLCCKVMEYEVYASSKIIYEKAIAMLEKVYFPEHCRKIYRK